MWIVRLAGNSYEMLKPYIFPKNNLKKEDCYNFARHLKEYMLSNVQFLMSDKSLYYFKSNLRYDRN